MKTIVTWLHIMNSAQKQANLIKEGKLMEAKAEEIALKKLVFEAGFVEVPTQKEENLNQIKLVLEYNGPWHYTKDQIVGCENEPAVPYRLNNSYNYTKQQVYEIDCLKINHIMKYAKKGLIYFEKGDTLLSLNQGEVINEYLS